MHSSKKNELSIKLPLLEHLNRTALSKDETVLWFEAARTSFSFNFFVLFGPEACNHCLYQTDLSSSRHMRKRHITSSMAGNLQLNTFTSLIESIHLRFDEIKEMSETSISNDTLGLVPQRQKAIDYEISNPIPQLQNVYPSADTSVPSQQELDLLFGPLYDEFFTTGPLSVNKSSSPTDNSKQQDTTPTTNIQSSTEPTTPTNVNAEENNDNQAEDCTTRWIKQAPRAWYDELSNFLMSKGFTKDADHVGCIDTRKSTSRGIQFLGVKLVSWLSKKQDCTAMSSAKAEYVVLSASFTQVENGIIELYFVRTEYQLADMFTKALSEDRFQYIVRRIGMRCLTPAELEVLANESA
ncbi:hypothetical protein Tco_0523277 [Tanacetum coccineum]